MTKKQLIEIITALEDCSRSIANNDAINSQRLKDQERGAASAYATIISMLKNPKYAREVAEIYEVNI